MARINLIEVENMTSVQKKYYDLFPSNLIRGMLHAENNVFPYMNLGGSFRNSHLSDQDREFTIVRVGYLSNCAYELMQHYDLAISTGWTKEDLEAAQNGNQKHFNEKTAVLMRFIDEAVFRVKVTDGTFQDARTYFSEAEIAELLLLIGHYMMTARFLESLEIEPDQTATPWEKGLEYLRG